MLKGNTPHQSKSFIKKFLKKCLKGLLQTFGGLKQALPKLSLLLPLVEYFQITFRFSLICCYLVYSIVY